MWWVHLIRDAPPSTFRYTLSKSSESSVVGLLDRAHIYAATIRVPWRAIPYDYVFRSSTMYTLSVLYYAYALWLMLRLIQPGVAYTGTHTDNPYWPVRRIGRKHADEHAWPCLTSHIRVIFAVRLCYYFLFFVLSSLLLSISTRRRFYPQRSSGQAVVTGVVSSPPRYVPSIFAHRVQHSHCSSIFIERC